VCVCVSCRRVVCCVVLFFLSVCVPDLFLFLQTTYVGLEPLPRMISTLKQTIYGAGQSARASALQTSSALKQVCYMTAANVSSGFPNPKPLGLTHDRVNPNPNPLTTFASLGLKVLCSY